jgi:hypothetical protein
MIIAPGTPLDVSLHWDTRDIQPVGRLAYRDQTAYLEYDETFLKPGLELSPVRHKTSPGLQRPYQTDVFEGLHGIFADSLPDGWGRLLVDRRARQLGIEPATLTPLDRLACVGDRGMGALCYAPATDAWETADTGVDLGRLAADARLVLAGNTSDVLATLGKAGGSPGGARPKRGRLWLNDGSCIRLRPCWRLRLLAVISQAGRTERDGSTARSTGDGRPGRRFRGLSRLLRWADKPVHVCSLPLPRLPGD